MPNGSDRVERNESYTAVRLHTSDIPGAVQVRVGTEATVRVRITGPEKLVEQIRREVRGGVLHISGPQTGGGGMTFVSRGGGQTSVFSHGGGMMIQGDNIGVISTGRGSVVIGGGGNVVVRNGRIISGGSEVTCIEPEEVRIIIDAPRLTAITIDENFAGSYQIGDLDGPLDLRLKGSGEVVAGRAAATRVMIHGSGNVKISAVTGPALNVSIHGSGDVSVRDGQVEDLAVDVHGSGEAVYGGTARSARLAVMGSGDIRVNEVTESLDDRSMGSGRIRVHCPPRRSPASFWS